MGRDSSGRPSCAPSRLVASSECFSGPGSRPRWPTAGSLTRYERDTVQRMLGRGASYKPIVRSLGRSPSMANSEVLEGGLLCGLRNDLGGQEVAAWQNWQFDKYGDRELRRGFPGGQLLFTLPSLAGVFKRVKLAGRRLLHVPHDVVHSAVKLHAQFYRADEFMIGESDLCPRPAVCDVVRPRLVYISTLRRVSHG